MDSIFDTDNLTTLHYNPSTGRENRLWIRYGDDTFEPVRPGGNVNRKYHSRTRPTDWWVTEKPKDWNPADHGFDVSLNHDFGEHDKPGRTGRGAPPRSNLFLRNEDIGKGRQTMEYRFDRDEGKPVPASDKKATAPVARRTTLAGGGEGYRRAEAEKEYLKRDEADREQPSELENTLDKKGLSFGGKDRSLWDGPKYGNWCGKNYSGGETGSEMPIDSSDRMCMQHDKGWDACDELQSGERKSCKEHEDENLVRRLGSLSDDPAEWPYPPPRALRNDAKTSRRAAIWWFKK